MGTAISFLDFGGTAATEKMLVPRDFPKAIASEDVLASLAAIVASWQNLGIINGTMDNRLTGKSRVV